MPAVLVEIGFNTNKYEEIRLTRYSYLNKIAESIFQGINEFIEGYINWLGAKEVKIATVFMKPETVSVPHYYERQVSQDTWIVFPYEVREFKSLSK